MTWHTVDTFLDWHYRAEPGDELVYYTGNLAADCDTKGNNRIRSLRKSIQSAAIAGEVLLTQRRIGKGVCEYLVTKPERRQPPPWPRLEERLRIERAVAARLKYEKQKEPA